jgi:membrane protein DedA with SNARE-associated domain
MISLSINLIGFVLLFVWVMVGSFGIPASTLGIIAMGSLSKSIPNLMIVIAVAYIAVAIGDILAYTLATKLSDEFKDKLRRFNFFRENEPKVKELLNKHGFPIVFFTRFFMLHLCAVTSYVSGFEKWSKKKFVLAVLTGEFLFAAGYSIIGFAIGEVANNLISVINYVLLAIVLLILLGYFLKKYLNKRKKNRTLSP